LDRGALPQVPPQHDPIHHDARAMRNRPCKSSTRVTLVLLGAFLAVHFVVARAVPRFPEAIKAGRVCWVRCDGRRRNA
jgi:hypothetical protein